MLKTLFVLIISLMSGLCAESNVWELLVPDQPQARYNGALVYHPDSSRFVLSLGHTADQRGTNSLYEVVMLSGAMGAWTNLFPDGRLYGVWGDSNGAVYGNGRFGPDVFKKSTYYFGFETIADSGLAFLRPNLGWYYISEVFYQYAYVPEQQKVYYFIKDRTFTYDLRTRLWDTLSTAVVPTDNKGLIWGSMCYDALNKELVLFGGGNSGKPNGHCGGTWLFSTETGTWRPLNGTEEPPPRAYSPMVYDAANQVIVLFGGDHLDFMMSDTWVYDCATRKWTQKSPAVSPSPRAGHALLYLPKSRSTVLLGGFQYNTTTLNNYSAPQYAKQAGLELWKYDPLQDEWNVICTWSSGVYPDDFRSPVSAMAAVDTGDRIVTISGSYHKTYLLPCDAGRSDAAATASLGVAQGKVQTRPGGWEPSWYQEGLADPDTLANETIIRDAPERQWVAVTPPKKHPYSDFMWGNVVYDPVHGLILDYNGGHSSYPGNQVLQYSANLNRWGVGYRADLPLELCGASGQYGTGITFNQRPFIPNHTYDAYCYNEKLDRMVLRVGSRTWLYNTVRRDFDSQFVENHSAFALLHHASTRLIQTDSGTYCWANQIFRLKEDTLAWRQVAVTGCPVPGYYSDKHGLAYDAGRGRLLYFGQGSEALIMAFDLRTSVICTVKAWNPWLQTSTAAQSFSKCVYLPRSGKVLFLRNMDGLHLMFDCSTDGWDTLRLGGAAPTGSIYSVGMVYDPGRDRVWTVDANLNIRFLRTGELPSAEGESVHAKPGDISLDVAPNPFSGIISLRFRGTSVLTSPETVLFDIAGRRVAMRKITPEKGGVSWTAGHLPAGVYILHVRTGGLDFTRKLVRIQ